MVSNSSVGSGDAEGLVDGRDVGVAGDALAAVGERVDAGLAVLLVELVLDLADDLLEHVLDGDQPGGVAELVDDDRDVVAVGAEVAQQVVEPFDSGTKTAGRSSVRRFRSGERCSLSRSLAIRMPMTLSRPPSKTGKRECAGRR